MIVFALRPAAVSLLALSLCAPNMTPGPAQAPVERPQAPAEPSAGPVLTCEVYCSEAKLRTANARLRWQTPAAGAEAAAAATGKAELQATVFPRGFEKGIYVTLPVGGALPAPAVAAQPKAQQARPLRAFDIRLIESTPVQRSAAGPAEAGVVVENLEPGMNYTFRLLLGGAAGRSTSQEVTCQAPVCPADMADEKVPQSAPRRTP